MKQKLLKAFKMLDNGSDEGVHSEMAFRELSRQGIAQSDMKKALAALADDGILYSTVDEDHFKSTE